MGAPPHGNCSACSPGGSPGPRAEAARAERYLDTAASSAPVSASSKLRTPQRARSVSIQSLSRAVKLALDVLLAAVLLLVMTPVFLMIVLLIQLESPGSPFYSARRVGYRGRPLDVLKFRKMHVDARGLPLTLVGDVRLTRIGALMARTRIDELPQLWNVLRGQMSLVGPRPEDPQFVALHAESYERILQVRPGITGWSQLAFAAESEILDQQDPVAHYIDRILPAKVHLDCKYAERPRVRHDIQVMAWTAAAMLSNVEVAVHREDGALARRRRGKLGSVSRAPEPVADYAPAPRMQSLDGGLSLVSDGAAPEFARSSGARV
jgi:lipopolysaccharide/colanic/teichoic acid biosynthesis glycosyltransferase